jgi:hypothetical protein
MVLGRSCLESTVMLIIERNIKRIKGHYDKDSSMKSFEYMVRFERLQVIVRLSYRFNLSERIFDCQNALNFWEMQQINGLFGLDNFVEMKFDKMHRDILSMMERDEK